MGRKKQGRFVRPESKGKDKRHKMKGKSLETFTEDMHTAFEGKNALIVDDRHYTTVVYVHSYFYMATKTTLSLNSVKTKHVHSSGEQIRVL